jgi:hypothetical protein
MTAVNVTVVSVIAGLTCNLCREKRGFLDTFLPIPYAGECLKIIAKVQPEAIRRLTVFRIASLRSQ